MRYNFLIVSKLTISLHILHGPAHPHERTRASELLCDVRRSHDRRVGHCDQLGLRERNPAIIRKRFPSNGENTTSRKRFPVKHTIRRRRFLSKDALATTWNNNDKHITTARLGTFFLCFAIALDRVAKVKTDIDPCFLRSVGTIDMLRRSRSSLASRYRTILSWLTLTASSLERKVFARRM